MPQYLSWEAIEAIERGAYRVLLFGPPGTGKTRSAYNTAKTLGKELFNITLSDETPAAELRGHYVPKGNIWEFMYGPAVRAAIHEQNGAVLLLDEIDKASQDCLDFLHGLLNDPDVAQMTLPSGEILNPNEKFQVIATMNGELDDLPIALQDRFKIAIEVTEPHPEAIASLPEDLQAQARKVEAYGVSQRPATIRAWHAFATLRELPDVTTEDAAKAIFAHRAGELMDAIGFRSSEFTPAVEEEQHSDDVPTKTEPCTCSDCASGRAEAWMSYNEHEVMYDENDSDGLAYGCPICDSWYEGREEALKCCFDDDEWITFCNDNNIEYAG